MWKYIAFRSLFRCVAEQGRYRQEEWAFVQNSGNHPLSLLVESGNINILSVKTGLFRHIWREDKNNAQKYSYNKKNKWKIYFRR